MAAVREHWTGRTGFLLAAVGSAVGLGNMWRFSYLTAEKGGAAFVALYLIFTLLVGLPVLLAELTIGRGAQRSPVQALAHFGGERWKLLGGVFVAAGFLILAYYGVIAGWTLRYAGAALFTGFDEDSGQYFGEVAEGPDAFLFHLIFMGVTIGVVSSGVRRGIERAALWLMPVLFALICAIALYAATLDGAGPGYAYYLNASFENAWSTDVVVAAAGQAFFSLSLGMGAMLTFASYLSREHDLPDETVIIAAADFGVAFVAGLMVFPLLFALGLSTQVIGGGGESTVGALFIVLPKAFATMGAAGRVVGLAFFVALVVGALTSAISLLEVVVASIIDGLGWSRRGAAWAAGAAITALGAPAAWSLGVLGAMDAVANNLFLVGGGLALAIFVGWVMRDPMGEVSAGTRGVRWFFAWRTLLRFIVPAVLVYVLWNSVPSTLSTVADLFKGG